MKLAERRDVETAVYQPAEDSRLLADAAVGQVDADDLVVEVGTGSGYVAERIADETGVRVVGTDLNPHACRQARERGVEAVRADLLAPIRDGAVDVVLFNPPYLPTDPAAEWDDWMETALSGGESGLAVVEPFLREVGRVLAPDGVVLLLVSSLTGAGGDPSGVAAAAELASEAGFSAVALRDESFPFETLTVLKLVG